ncbi:MAG TPA: transcriptional repressor LexA [Ignavibacteria bacterium]|nr:repressor LexA [Bacteroidota bacterium]HRI84829.1 transcriptional repressor LexA [Ignavibacteria bacterium]HRK00539.1 transcriptional repressor LexA [Ignavibacteria bacterium]
MHKLTSKQKKILEFIEKYGDEYSYPPTLKEIGEKFNVTIGTIQDHIKALQNKGYLERKKDIARGFKLIKTEEESNIDRLRSGLNIIPLYGSVAAGEPIFADDNVQGYVTMEKNGKGHKIHFALKVKGDSMIDSGIYDGDIVIVRKQDSAEDGDVVIALLEDEATVKTLRNRRIKAYLEASNSKYKSIINKPFKIIGKVIELRREYSVI